MICIRLTLRTRTQSAFYLLVFFKYKLGVCIIMIYTYINWATSSCCSSPFKWQRKCGNSAMVKYSYCFFGPSMELCCSTKDCCWECWHNSIPMRWPSGRPVSSDYPRRLSNRAIELVVCLPIPMARLAMDQPDTTTHRFGVC